jgi:hypothetical protein
MMRRMKWWTVTWVAMLGCACFVARNGASVEFFPRVLYGQGQPGEHFDRSTGRAVLCTEDQRALLTEAGGIMIGTMRAHGDTDTTTQADVARDALLEAARNGGTHVIVGKTDTASSTFIRPGHSDAECHGTGAATECTVTTTPEERTVQRTARADFVVVRVPATSWDRLPANLRPKPGS